MGKEGEGFACLRQTFPKISKTQMKVGIFLSPHIKQLLEDHEISAKLNGTERIAWKAFENACRNFLGNEKAENYSEIVHELISSYSAMGCNMSLKLHVLG